MNTVSNCASGNPGIGIRESGNPRTTASSLIPRSQPKTRHAITAAHAKRGALQKEEQPQDATMQTNLPQKRKRAAASNSGSALGEPSAAAMEHAMLNAAEAELQKQLSEALINKLKQAIIPAFGTSRTDRLNLQAAQERIGYVAVYAMASAYSLMAPNDIDALRTKAIRKIRLTIYDLNPSMFKYYVDVRESRAVKIFDTIEPLVRAAMHVLPA